MKKLFTLLLLAALLLSSFSVTAFAEDKAADVPPIEAKIAEIKKYGNIVLSVGAETMQALGYEVADMILVRIGDKELAMPIGTAYSDVDIANPICCYKTSSSTGQLLVILAINSGDLATTMGIAEYRDIEDAPGYEWVFAEGLEDATVSISMMDKQGYAAEYALHQLVSGRSNNREDYPDLSDAAYANFRAVETTGMGVDTLYRSSSPVNPALNRDEEADAALLTALIRTVMNMADSEKEMRSFADFSLKNYASCDIIALSMGIDYTSDDYREKLAEGLRFFASHEGPYLIHCKEGKDRTGFAAALLECLMGASADEVARDYMLTFYNFYGLDPDSDQAQQIAASNIETILATAFGIPSIRDEGVDLRACAEAYLRDIGLTEDEIAALKQNLSADYGGIG